MFEMGFNCDSSQADNILLLLLLKADYYGWSRFEVEHDYKLATFILNSQSDNSSALAVILGKNQEDITIYNNK